MNKEYSHKDFTGQSLSSRPAADFNNSEIIGSCFYQEDEPNTHVFPEGITGVTFKKCNLDNVYIPPGNILENCTNKKIKLQNDMEDWVVANNLKPIEPLNKEIFQELSLSSDPKDIPATWEREEMIPKEEWDASFALSQIGDHFKELPVITETKYFLVDNVPKQFYIIKGAADVSQKGKTKRLCLNLSVTQAAYDAIADSKEAK